MRNLSENQKESSVFREMELSEEALSSLNDLLEEGYEPGRLLSVLLPWENFRIPPESVWNRGVYLQAAGEFQTFRSLELSRFQKAMSAVWDDLEEFPLILYLSMKIPGFLTEASEGKGSMKAVT